MEPELPDKVGDGKKTRTWIQQMSKDKYDIIIQLVTGTFKVPKAERTAVHKSTIRQFQRRKEDFTVTSSELFFKGKKVVPNTGISKTVKTTLTQNLGSGSRSTWLQISKKQSAVSFATVKKVLGKSELYRREHPAFKNQIPPKPVRSDAVNERWQMDLINMQADAVVHNGEKQKYIFSVLDNFSRFTFLRPLPNKTCTVVAKALTVIFSEHGMPKIMQCDQGTEFKGKVEKLLCSRGIKLIRSSPYHPQSQGKCERSHREVKSKIRFKVRESRGFNWAQNLYEIQEAVNNVPKEVLGNRSPAEVYGNRGNVTLCQAVRKASLRSSMRMTKSLSRKIQTSVYRKGEKVLIRYPPKGGSKLVPRRRFVCRGIIKERDLRNNKYKVSFKKPDGKIDSTWIFVSDITRITTKKEKIAASRSLSQELKKDLHREKYYIPLTSSNDEPELQNTDQEAVISDVEPEETSACYMDESTQETQELISEVEEADLLSSDDSTHETQVVSQDQEESNSILNITDQGFRVDFNPQPDGSCMFSAIADQLRSHVFGIERSAETLRQEVVKEIARNRSQYQGFLTKPFDAYIKELSKSSTFGDHVCLQAIANIFYVVIQIISSRGPVYNETIKPPSGGYREILLGYFPEDGGAHYLSLSRLNSIETTEENESMGETSYAFIEEDSVISLKIKKTNVNDLPTEILEIILRSACHSDQLTRQMLLCVSIRFNAIVKRFAPLRFYLRPSIDHLAQSGVLSVRALCNIAGIHSGVVQSVKESIGSTRGKTIHNAWIVVEKESNGQFRILRVFWRT